MKEVFTIEERKSKDSKETKTYWNRVGSAFENKDGSVNVYLTALPVNGKLQIRDKKEKDEE
jgi:hypothetical protein